MNELNRAIIRTLVYFDIFDYPLTLVEIWKWLHQPGRFYSISEVQAEIASLSAYAPSELRRIARNDKMIETKNGFYFLIGKQWTVEQRLSRYSLAEAKYRRAIRFIKLLRFIPFIKMIAVCNSLAYSNSGEKGDIDFFIIARANRLWLTRFLTVGFLKLLGVRPGLRDKSDAIDANFFLSEDALNIVDLRVLPDDIYLPYWIDQLVPVFDTEGTYHKLQQANDWVKRILPNSFGYELSERRQVGLTPLARAGQLIIKFLFDYDFKEKILNKFQLKVMPSDLRQMMNQDTRVVVSEHVLKFHREDRRQEYADKFKTNLLNYEKS